VFVDDRIGCLREIRSATLVRPPIDGIVDLHLSAECPQETVKPWNAV
jgi:hypothetical protein